ncbi:hypothetical protein B1H10_02925 [candidate division KSB1 bacterium 4484_188]|nr:MAG: hypothetical protein B1H10_02925 [candidate division KSB1 bacterium 4484_188]
MTVLTKPTLQKIYFKNFLLRNLLTLIFIPTTRSVISPHLPVNPVLLCDRSNITFCLGTHAVLRLIKKRPTRWYG